MKMKARPTADILIEKGWVIRESDGKWIPPNFSADISPGFNDDEALNIQAQWDKRNRENAIPAPRPTCGTCPYWKRVGDCEYGECRGSFPPAHRTDPDETWAIGDWPVTEPSEWCGQHPKMAAWIRDEWPKVRAQK